MIYKKDYPILFVFCCDYYVGMNRLYRIQCRLRKKLGEHIIRMIDDNRETCRDTVLYRYLVENYSWLVV